MRRRALALAVAVAAGGVAAAIPSSAAGDGGPAADFLTPRSTSAAGTGGPRVVVKEHGKTTAVKLVGAGATRRLTIAGRYAIPAIAFDGSSTGMSADGRTLLLHSAAPPTGRVPNRSGFALLSTNPLRLARRFSLPARFTADALAPDGSRVYFVHHNAHNLTRYSVRAYDVANGRLEPQPIVDPAEHGGEMRGVPQTRAYSPDGRWAYTLYDGGEEGAFVHALDTARGRAHCIDLPELPGHPYGGAHVHVTSGGGELRITKMHKGVIALVDTGTLEARLPGAGAASDAADQHSPGGGDWATAALPVGVLAALGALWLAVRRRSAGVTG